MVGHVDCINLAIARMLLITRQKGLHLDIFVCSAGMSKSLPLLTQRASVFLNLIKLAVPVTNELFKSLHCMYSDSKLTLTDM